MYKNRMVKEGKWDLDEHFYKISKFALHMPAQVS